MAVTDKSISHDVLEYQRIRRLRSVRWEDPRVDPIAVPESFFRFAEDKFLAGIPAGRQGWHEKKRLLCVQLYWLILTGLAGKTIVDSRSNSDAPRRKRVKLWNLLLKHGLAKSVNGHRTLRYRTRYYASKELLQQIQGFESSIFPEVHRVKNAKNSGTTTPQSIVYGHTGTRDLVAGCKLTKSNQKLPLPLPSQGESDWITIELFEFGLDVINRVNNSHDWKVQHQCGATLRPSVALHQVHVGAWGRSFRCYTSGRLSAQRLSKSVRSTITIDGEPTVELDFSALFPRMLYHIRKIEIPGDVYRTSDVFPVSTANASGDEASFKTLRDFVKRVTNICFNTRSRSKARVSILNFLRKHEKKNHECLRKIIREIEGMTIETLLDRLEQVHTPIRDTFYTSVGMDLMTHEASIMITTLVTMTLSGRPVLGIHDGVLCKQSDADFAEQTLVETYQSRFPGFTPVINRSNCRPGQGIAVH